MRRRRHSIARQRRRDKFICTSLVVGVVFSIFFGLSVYGLWQQPVRIQSIEISGTETLEPLTLVESVNIALLGVRAVVPRNSIFFFPKKHLLQVMQNQFPRIRTSTIRRIGFSKIQIAINERTPVFSWCGVTKEKAQSCFLTDDTGFIFAPEGSARQKITVYGKLLGENPLRSTVYDPRAIPRTLPLIQSLNKSSVNISSLTFKDANEIAMTVSPGIVVTYVLGEEAFIAEALPQLLATVDRETIQAIDMRFGKRVYIKRRE